MHFKTHKEGEKKGTQPSGLWRTTRKMVLKKFTTFLVFNPIAPTCAIGAIAKLLPAKTPT
jgi:hypothetical protein